MLKRKIKTITALVLVIVLVLPLFACGKNNKEENVSEGDTITYKWLIPTQQSISLSASKIVQEIQNRFNVVLDFDAFTPGEMFNNKKNLAFLDSNAYDVVTRITVNEASQYGSDGMFVDLNEHKDKIPNILAWLDKYPMQKTNAYTSDGKMYCFPSIKEDIQQSSLTFSAVDKQLEAVGKSMDDLATMDGFLDTLRALKQKNPTKYPFTAYTKLMGVDLFMYPFITSFTKGITGFYNVTEPAFDYNQNKYVDPFDVKGYKEAIEFINTLYSEKLIDPDHTTIDGGGAVVNALKQGDSAITYGFVGGLSGIYTTQQDIKEANPDWTLVPFPTPQASGDKVVYDIGSMHVGVEGTAVSSQLSGEKLDRILEVIDWLYSEEAYNLLYWHDDVTATDESGNHYYKNEEIYKGTRATVDVYLPWSMMEFFQVNYFTQYDKENEMTKYREKYVLGDENAEKYVTPVALNFTFDEIEELTMAKSKVNTYFLTNISSILQNNGKLDWDTFVQEMRDRGVTRMVEIYNQAYERCYPQ